MKYEYYYRSRSLSPPPLLPSAFARTARSVSPAPAFLEPEEIRLTSSYRRDSFSDHVDKLLARLRAMREYRESSLEPYQYSGYYSELDDLGETRRSSSRVSSHVFPPLSPWSKTGIYYYPSYNYWVWSAYTPVEQQLENYRTRLESEVQQRLHVPNCHQQWSDHDDLLTMEIEYMYPESWRGTSGTLPLKRDYYSWSNPGRYYRYRSYYPSYYSSYTPSYRMRYYR